MPDERDNIEVASDRVNKSDTRKIILALLRLNGKQRPKDMKAFVTTFTGTSEGNFYKALSELRSDEIIERVNESTKEHALTPTGKEVADNHLNLEPQELQAALQSDDPDQQRIALRLLVDFSDRSEFDLRGPRREAFRDILTDLQQQESTPQVRHLAIKLLQEIDRGADQQNGGSSATVPTTDQDRDLDDSLDEIVTKLGPTQAEAICDLYAVLNKHGEKTVRAALNERTSGPGP